MKNVILVISLSLAFLLSACERTVNIGCISPEGSVEEQVVEFASFERIEIVGDAEIVITEGPVQEVIVIAAPNIIDRLIEDSRVDNNELIVEINGCSRIDNGELALRITMPELSGLTIRGDGSFETNGIFENIENLPIDIIGDGDINLELGDIDLFSAGILGDGNINCTGSAEALQVSINGDGEVDLVEFPGGSVGVNMRGDGDCKVSVTESIDIKMIGDGKIEAFGEATLQEIEVAGDVDIDNEGLSTEVTNIEMVGDGNIEVLVSDELNVMILGDGKVCYKGNPTVNIDTPLTGEVEDCN